MLNKKKIRIISIMTAAFMLLCNFSFSAPQTAYSASLIEAESFTSQSGIRTEACAEGGENI